MKKLGVILFFLLNTVSLLAINFEGEYVMKGWDPYEKTNYSGFATLTKENNDLYQFFGAEGSKQFRGTGMMCCKDVAAFVTVGNGSEIYLTIYQINSNTLKGKWLILNQNMLGTEELLKK